MDVATTDSTQPRPSSRLADTVYDQVLRLILSGEFPKNCKLPTEHELGDRLGVSRPIVRLALARLRAEGYVQSQRGSGTIVTKGAAAAPLAYPPIRTVADLQRWYEFRIAIEQQTAALAARRHTKEGLEGIEQALKEVDFPPPGHDPDLHFGQNFAFHRAVARASQNPYFIVTIEGLPNLVGFDPILGTPDGAAPGMRHHDIVAEHAAIYEAIRNRDAERARREMIAHLSNARELIFEHQRIR